MTLNRYATRKDANHTAITGALDAAGVRWFEIEWPADLIAINRQRQPVFLEIKRDAKAKLTDVQRELFELVADTHIARVVTAEDALRAVGAIA